MRTGPADSSWLRVVEGRPEDCDGVVVLFHGGIAKSQVADRPSAAYHRMSLFRRPLRRATAGRLAVVQVFNPSRGWGYDRGRGGPADAERLLALVRERFGDLPIGLIGHSSGGWVALRVAGSPGVRSVVALAPWLPDGMGSRQLSGVDTLLIHGLADRVTSAAASARYVERVRAQGMRARLITVPREGHAMLRRAGLWHRESVDHTVAALGVVAPR